jgi:hypothetical protein
MALDNLPSTGTYTIRVMPSNGATGITNVGVMRDVAAPLAIDGAAVPVDLNFQFGRYTFNGTTGQSLGLGWTGLTGTGGITVQRPDGLSLPLPSTFCLPSTPSGGCVLSPLPMGGTYTVKVDPPSGTHLTMNLRLVSDVVVQTPLTVGGASIPVTLGSVGQAATYSFNGTAGQTMTLKVSGDTIPGVTYFDVIRPNGLGWTYLPVNYTSGVGTNGSLVLSNLPMTGTYTIRVRPQNGAVGSVAVGLQ